jgi:hypothetical protein
VSGQATGWVLRHGPRDRALRLVLIAIADAANRDGENSQPGQDAVVEASLYSPGHVRRAIARLVEEGWLEVQEHAAPGRATTYRIPGVAEENAAHSARRSEASTGTDGARTSRDSGGDGARTARAQTRAPTSTGNENEDLTPPTPPWGEEAVSLCEHLAERIEAFRPTHLRPAVTDRWRKDMQLLLDRGPTGIATPSPLGPERVRRAIDVVFDRLASPEGARGFCWAAQIESPGGLRSKWNRLANAARRTGPGSSTLATIAALDERMNGHGG